MPLLDPPRIAYSDASSVVATWRTLAFTAVGPRSLTPHGAAAQVDACEAHGRAVGPGRMIEIVILDPYVGFPTREVREVLEQGATRAGPYYAGVGTIFESRGFRAAAIRGLLRSLALASSTEFPQKVFATTGACVDWVLPLAAAAGSLAFAEGDLLEAISHVRGAAQQSGVLTVP